MNIKHNLLLNALILKVNSPNLESVIRLFSAESSILVDESMLKLQLPAIADLYTAYFLISHRIIYKLNFPLINTTDFYNWQ